MTLDTLLRLIGGLVLLLMNAFFVATEFALTRIRQYDASEFEDDPRLQHAWKMTERLEIYLTSCQVGITTTSILLGVIAEPAVTLLLQPIIDLIGIGPRSTHLVAITVGVILINLAHTVWGEQTPTYLGVERAKTVARYCARPHYVWTKAMYPFIYVGDIISKATLKLFGVTMERSWIEAEEPTRADLMDEMSNLLQSGDLAEDRQEEVLQALAIDEIPTRDIMVPRDEVVPLSTSQSLEENLEVIREHMRTRYPLVGDSLDAFKGVLYASEILGHIDALQAGDLTLDDLDRSDLTVPADLPVSRLIDRFQEAHEELALVVEDDQVVGLVTLTDALETIVGSVEDPLDLERQEGDDTQPARTDD